MKAFYDAMKYRHNPGEILETLEAAGLVVVPREPTKAMLDCPDFPYSPGEARQYWLAMIDAAREDVA